MRNLLITLTGFMVGAGLIAAVAFAVPRQTATTASGIHMGAGVGSGMMAAAAAPTTAKLTIQHVQKGCHVWSNGKTTAAMMRLHLKVGQKLSILDMDVDAHQMMQLAGPAQMRMGAPMMMNRSMTLSLSRRRASTASAPRLFRRPARWTSRQSAPTTSCDWWSPSHSARKELLRVLGAAAVAAKAAPAAAFPRS